MDIISEILMHKLPETLSVQHLAVAYKKQRLDAQRALKHSDPLLVEKSGLKEPSPFESVTFLSGMLHLANQIGPAITNYHLMSDERSGRIPTLVLASWQANTERFYHLPTNDPPRIDFVLASERAAKRNPIKTFLTTSRDRLVQKPNLIVTDYLDTGGSMVLLLEIMDELKIPADLAVLSHYEPIGSYPPTISSRKIYKGDVLPGRILSNTAGGKVINRDSLTGLTFPNQNNPIHHPVLKDEQWRKRPLEILVRKQAHNFGQMLPIPKIS